MRFSKAERLDAVTASEIIGVANTESIDVLAETREIFQVEKNTQTNSGQNGIIRILQGTEAG